MATERTTTERRKTETGTAALRRRVAELSAMLGEAEAALSAIRGGEVDAVAVSTPAGNAVHTLQGGERAFRARRRSARGGDRWFESLQGRQFPLPLDVPLDVPPPESPLVSALEPFQVPAPRHVVHGIGTEIEKDRQIARLEDALFALDVHEPPSLRQDNMLAKIT
jgi:hypothetical protein